MNGQWIGAYSGSNSGTIILNVDDIGERFRGFAYVNDDNPLLPSTAATFETVDKSRSFSFETTRLYPINQETAQPDSWSNVKPSFPDVMAPAAAKCIGTWDEKTLNISWETNIGTSGSAEIKKNKSATPSKVRAKTMTWTQYKKYVLSLEHRRYMFRGQNCPARLRTTFHRSGRADLQRFLEQDVPSLYKHLSARTRHIFNLEIPDQNGAFFNLAQHHGYPTPLLDWSYSPYVAAFFAFRGVSKVDAEKAGSKDVVRIYLLDQRLWRRDWRQLSQLTNAGPHFSISEFMSMGNERMIPQQAVSTVTNIDDIEEYIRTMGERKGSVYLHAIDMKKSERQSVIRELAYMGITAGSLFPGLDGACEELRERNFNL